MVQKIRRGENRDELWLVYFSLNLMSLFLKDKNRTSVCVKKSHSIAFLCTSQSHYNKSSWICLVNSIIRTQQRDICGCCSSWSFLLTPQWVLPCVFTSLLVSTLHAAPNGKCKFDTCQWADSLPANKSSIEFFQLGHPSSSEEKNIKHSTAAQLGLLWLELVVI